MQVSDSELVRARPRFYWQSRWAFPSHSHWQQLHWQLEVESHFTFTATASGCQWHAGGMILRTCQ